METFIRPAQEIKEAGESKRAILNSGLAKVLLALFLVLALTTSTVFLLVQKVTVKVDNKNLKIYTIGGTVKKALEKAKVHLKEKDIVNPSLASKLKDGTIVEVKRAVPVEIVISGKSKIVQSAQPTVKQLLVQEKINIAKEDKITPALIDKVSPNMKINIIRVNSANETNEVELAFSVEQRLDNNIEVGFSKVLQNGEMGLEKQVIKVTYEDGKEVKREVVSKDILRQPKNQVVAIGNLRTISRGGQNLKFTRVAFMTATGYTHTGNRTATGTSPHRGIIAVDPGVIPMGSRLYIENYGYAVAADTGGAIRGNIIDLFFETVGEAQRWGRRNVKVYILE